MRSPGPFRLRHFRLLYYWSLLTIIPHAFLSVLSQQLNNSEEKPTARVELKIQDAKRKTKFRKDAKSPEWKQKFSFPLKDPRNEVLKGSGWRKSRK
ncbi:hypothetical protein XENTR_v10004443 [Xenopus tropicalis]|uniref:Uncharacterized protein LOC105945212 isoform X1 n=1 Tax=Xenopus tropicalis TaxID=8364 RepID=A0A8J1IXB4_XENTR|nr:uncharacterized protein LOC105945212 isoform X1 [Xenopus tropicalis]KAE8577137.1 hypothetical protein XENTR_v10004443 [Xenopus tropicalis]